MNVGKLYEVKECFWLSFPSKETVKKRLNRPGSWPPTAFNTAEEIAISASYWSSEFDCGVSYISPESFIICLEEDKNFRKFLTADGQIYWTWFEDAYTNCFAEVNS